MNSSPSRHGFIASVRQYATRHWVELSTALGGLIAMNLILLARAYWETDQVNPTTAGQLGDFVGGYIGTAFVLLSVVLLYRTLQAQRKSAQLQSFEARYFELIRLHRENVAEMRIGDAEGRRVFLPMLRELWAARQIVEDCASYAEISLTAAQKLHISYYCIFFGAGKGSSRMLKASLPGYDANFLDQLDEHLRDENIREGVRENSNLAYVPFEGHQARLGHYFRHLYQAVKYVNRQTLEIDHYEYVKTIRAQLSTHEQALLLINSLSPFGTVWWKDGLMLKYRMVKNIPQHFISPAVGIDFQTLFPPGYFEWEESEGAV